MPDLLVVTARPVSVSRNGKVKARKRKANSLGVLGTVTDFVYPGGSKKLMKDATAQPFKKKKRKKKAKANTKKRKPARKMNANRKPARKAKNRKHKMSKAARSAAIKRGMKNAKRKARR
jgi:hypothetical protein